MWAYEKTPLTYNWWECRCVRFAEFWLAEQPSARLPRPRFGMIWCSQCERLFWYAAKAHLGFKSLWKPTERPRTEEQRGQKKARWAEKSKLWKRLWLRGFSTALRALVSKNHRWVYCFLEEMAVHTWSCGTPSQPFSNCGVQWMQPPRRSVVDSAWCYCAEDADEPHPATKSLNISVNTLAPVWT